jgi:hypothetical protein
LGTGETHTARGGLAAEPGRTASPPIAAQRAGIGLPATVTAVNHRLVVVIPSRWKSPEPESPSDTHRKTAVAIPTPTASTAAETEPVEAETHRHGDQAHVHHDGNGDWL